MKVREKYGKAGAMIAAIAAVSALILIIFLGEAIAGELLAFLTVSGEWTDCLLLLMFGTIPVLGIGYTIFTRILVKHDD